jgi:type IV secretory pathway VirB10-like protein
MHFKSWIKEIFLTDPELITGKRFIKWKRFGLAAFISIFIAMLGVAVFGQSKPEPDYRNYQSLSADDISKNGVKVLSGLSPNTAIQRKIASSKQYSAPAGSEQGQIISRKERSKSEYVLPAGSKIPALLDGDLNSELSQSPVTATLTNSFSFQGRTLLPAGTRILGHLAQGQDSDRIGAMFDQFVLPNGHQISIQGVATMLDGSTGIVGEFHSSRGLRVAGALGSSFLSGAAGAFQSTQANSFGIQQPDNTSRNAILNGVAQAALEQGRRFSEEAQQNPGYVTASSGTSFLIYVERETDLSGVYQ